jgi:DEAD/DEAH box helicase domain-containing protein
MAASDILHSLDVYPAYRSRIAHIETFEPASPRYGNLTYPLSPALEGYLEQNNIRLYTHQCEAIDAARAGKNIILTTSTASGKTLAFNIPVFEVLETDSTARALYLYPTKALANDQLIPLEHMSRFTGIPVHPAIYDGDTPHSKRAAIRASSRIILSNPHELHQALCWHTKWQPFLSGLRYIVIDEAHRYRGVFGSHIALVLRRLLRVCRYYGAQPRIIISTATLANPREFAGNLTGREFVSINKDGAPHGRRHFILYNPFFDGISEKSVHQETKDLLVSCVRAGLQTLCFTGSRKMAELVTLWAREDVRILSARLTDAIAVYRAGFLPEERRTIEHKLKNGSLKGVISTNALELGIDIGSLDAVIISGYPGTMMSTHQQAGRAGRKGGESVAILVAQSNPLDQYFMKHPARFFGRSHEHAIINTRNPYILTGHLLCAAAEMPLHAESDQQFFGELMDDCLQVLRSHDLVRNTSRGWVYIGRGRAADAVRLDGMSGETFRVLCQGRLLEVMDRGQAYREAHKGAIMLHQGETYVVHEMDLETHTIRVTQTDVDYYTQPLKDVTLSILDTLETREINGINCAFGDVEVTEHFTGYKIKRRDTIIGIEPLDLPPLTFRTQAFWFVPPQPVEQNVNTAGRDFAGGLHGVEHAIISLMPFHVMCDRWDVGGLSSPSFGTEGAPVIFVYDACDGGIGLAEKAFTLLPDLLVCAHELVRECRCEDGCPSCIHSPKCGNDNQPLDKVATILILEDLCHRFETPRPVVGTSVPEHNCSLTVPE